MFEINREALLKGTIRHEVTEKVIEKESEVVKNLSKIDSEEFQNKFKQNFIDINEEVL